MLVARIRSRIPKDEARKLLRELPGVLAGTKPDRFGVGQAFRVRCGVQLLSMIHAGFMTKARGQSDVLSQQWAPLKPATIKQKKRLGLSDYRARLINRRSDRLITSLKPGPLSGRHYKPPADQVFDVDGPFVVVGTRVSYSKYVHRKRPFWPKAMRLRDWMVQTVRAGRDEVLAVLTRRMGQ